MATTPVQVKNLSAPTIALGGNDDRPMKALTRINTTTGIREVATGLTLTVFLSTSETGSAVDATLSKTMSEIGSTGQYQSAYEGADLVTYLASSAGAVVYEITTISNDIRHVTPRRVVAVRRA